VLSDEDLVPLRWCWYPQTYGSKSALLPSSGGLGVPKDWKPIWCSRTPLNLSGRSSIHTLEVLEESTSTTGGRLRKTVQFPEGLAVWKIH
jgi:hypothetical protein